MAACWWACQSALDTVLAGDSLIRVARNPCTEVQVFHRQYRENEAKTKAKVECALTHLFLFI